MDSDCSLRGRAREGAHSWNKLFLRKYHSILRITDVGVQLLPTSCYPTESGNFVTDYNDSWLRVNAKFLQEKKGSNYLSSSDKVPAPCACASIFTSSFSMNKNLWKLVKFSSSFSESSRVYSNSGKYPCFTMLEVAAIPSSFKISWWILHSSSYRNNFSSISCINSSFSASSSSLEFLWNF